MSGETRGFDAVYLPSEVKEQLCRELLAELGVTRIVRSRDELKHQCVMPWHEDRNPSAGLNFEKLVYSCFSCGSSGGFLWLLSTALSTTGDGAREWVDTKSGLGPGDEFNLSLLLSMFDAIAAGQAPEQRTIPKFSPRAIEPWTGLIHPVLTTGVPEVGLAGRGIPEGNLREMQVGYAEAYPIGQEGEVSERIVIPHFWRGDLVGWQSRRVWDDGTPKYLSTVNMPKDTTLYDHDPTREWAVAVESPMSVLRQRHHLPMVATFGASLTEAQISILAEYDKVILWMDNDKAGWTSTAEVGTALEAYTEVWVVDSPWAADAGDMDEETAAALVAEAVPFALWARPTVLRCWICKQAHEGPCPRTSDGEEVKSMGFIRHGTGEVLPPEPDEETEVEEETEEETETEGPQ